MHLKYVFKTTTCKQCSNVERELNLAGHTYEKIITVDVDSGAIELAREYGIVSVPSFVTEDNKVLCYYDLF